jgi:predicted nucleic-acid-binding protein
LIGLDTNVLVRLLTGDDAAHRSAANEFISRNCSADNSAFINRIVLVETIWVLESVYEFSREEIAGSVDTLLRMVRVLTEDSDLVRFALTAYRRGADFADALIAATNVARGCSKTVRFGRKAR